MTVTIPWPPSVNHYWRRTEQRGRMAISAKGRAFRNAVLAAFLEQHGYGWRARVDPYARYQLHISASPPDRRRRDLDNVLKATLDALEHARIFHDDAQVDDLHIVRANPSKHGELRIILRPLP